MTHNLESLIEIADLRQAWPNEAFDFTPWLAKEENISKLGDAIGIDISVDETESSVGSFSLDISATETGTDRKIIIENQLEDTNHDHLGKLITYASGKSANIIIWVVKHAREEHRAAIEWLNNHTDDKVGFFLCEIKLFRIGESPLAPKFEVIEKPNDWAKDIKQSDTASGIEKLRLEYWGAFLEYANANSEFRSQFGRRSPAKDHWLSYGIGTSRFNIQVLQIRKRNLKAVCVELHIHNDKDLFHEMASNKAAIESEIGEKLEWMELRDKKASRIVVSKKVSLSDKNAWGNQFKWIVSTMIKMKAAFHSYI